MKVLIACGGTGGHIFPALALADQLKEQGIDILFVGTKRKLDAQIQRRKYDFIALDITAISVQSAKKFLTAFLKLVKTTFHSLSILLKVKPDVVVGFGGYASGPIVLIAFFLRIPTVIHEQNVRFGKTNYLLSKVVDKVAVSFPPQDGRTLSRKQVITGCPVRSELLEVSEKQAYSYFGFSENKCTLMITGGSLGSHSINEVVLDALGKIKNKTQLQVIHSTGEADYKKVSQAYRILGINAKTFVFLEEMGYAYTVADVLISRAGGSTLSEIVLFRLPAIIVPYPFAGEHQLFNAAFLSDRNAAVLMREQAMTGDSLAKKLDTLISDKSSLKQLQENLGHLRFPDAAKLLATEVVNAGAFHG
ncbi:undecaprenyldiphospho-muramoylpentapeptide beta-N-acetylglucosaminyltransferase [Candidatus Omnitrophota bacterium]